MEDELVTKKARTANNESMTPIQLVQAKEAIIEFAPQYPSHTYQLFELPTELVDYVSQGGDLFIKGSGVGVNDAVVCNDNKTFSLKKVETSNDVFVIPGTRSNPACSFTIDSTPIHQYYEMRPCNPNCDRIIQLLSTSMYTSRADDATITSDSKLYTRKELEDMALASKEEFSAALSEIGAVEIDGFMRLLSPTAVRAATRALLDTIIESSMSLTAIDFDKCLVSTYPIDEVILTSVFRNLSASESIGAVWEFDASKVCRASAHSIFDEHKMNRIEREDFLADWSMRTPCKDSPNEELLRGIAIIDDLSSSAVRYYQYLPETELSRDLNTRINQLFSVRQRFTLQELEPYLVKYFGGKGQPKSLQELAISIFHCVDGYYSKK